MDWNDETNARLRQFWDDGLSTAEIGRRLSVSKNAVVGKAHRLMLRPRPSPIRRDAAAPPRPAGPRRVLGPTLPPLPAESLAAPPPLDLAPVPVLPPVEILPPFVPLPAPADTAANKVVELAPAIRAAPPSRGRQTACCWPLGDPGTKTFRFCDGQSLSGKPYCAAHAQLAYVKVRDRREEVAA